LVAEDIGMQKRWGLWHNLKWMLQDQIAAPIWMHVEEAMNGRWLLHCESDIVTEFDLHDVFLD